MRARSDLILGYSSAIVVEFSVGVLRQGNCFDKCASAFWENISKTHRVWTESRQTEVASPPVSVSKKFFLFISTDRVKNLFLVKVGPGYAEVTGILLRLKLGSGQRVVNDCSFHSAQPESSLRMTHLLAFEWLSGRLALDADVPKMKIPVL